MTTAARPTWAPAVGGDDQGGVRTFGPSRKVSSKDIAAHTTLKVRKEGQDTAEEIKKRDLRGDLEDRERRHFREKGKDKDDRKRDRARLEAPPEDQPQTREEEDGEGAGGGSHPTLNLRPRAIDADDSDGEAPGEDSSDESDDDEDDTAALMAELERIKKERAVEEARKARAAAEAEASAKERDIMTGNPLINAGGSFGVKRRWDDDVVFRNQTRGEVKPTTRFVNDTIRSDFHRKFLNKYVNGLIFAYDAVMDVAATAGRRERARRTGGFSMRLGYTRPTADTGPSFNVRKT
eukprot:jgi/Mesvir1/5378/Mv15457-RA.1